MTSTGQDAPSSRPKGTEAVSRPARVAARASALARAHPAVAAFGLFLLLALVTRPAFYWTPLRRDAGQYLYVGGIVLDGGVPYLDAANNKGPLTYLLFAAIGLLAGDSALIVRLTLVLFAALAALALAAYVARLAGRATGLLAGALLSVLLAAPALEGPEPNTEQYGLVPMLGALWAATRPGMTSAAAAGALCAASVLVNPLFGVVVPFAAFELWRACPGVRDRLLRLGTALTAGLAVLALAVAWLTATGALDDAWVQVVDAVIRAGDPAASGPGPDEPGAGLPRLPYLWLLGLAGSLLALRERRLRLPAVTAACWTAVCYARVALPSYEFAHHSLLALVGIATSIALGLASLRSRGRGPQVLLGVFFVAFVVGSAVVVPQLRALGTPALERFGPASPAALSYPVAAFVRAETVPGDTIFVAGSTPMVYWLADRRAPTRFFDFYPVLLRPEYALERAADLRSRPPAAIARLPEENGVPRPLESDLAVLLRRGYRLAYRADGAEVWLKKDRTRPP